MGRTKDYIIRMMDEGLDVLHPNHISDEEYYEIFFEDINNKKQKNNQENIKLIEEVLSDLK